MISYYKPKLRKSDSETDPTVKQPTNHKVKSKYFWRSFLFIKRKIIVILIFFKFISETLAKLLYTLYFSHSDNFKLTINILHWYLQYFNLQYTTTNTYYVTMKELIFILQNFVKPVFYFSKWITRTYVYNCITTVPRQREYKKHYHQNVLCPSTTIISLSLLVKKNSALCSDCLRTQSWCHVHLQPVDHTTISALLRFWKLEIKRLIELDAWFSGKNIVTDLTRTGEKIFSLLSYVRTCFVRTNIFASQWTRRVLWY